VQKNGSVHLQKDGALKTSYSKLQDVRVKTGSVYLPEENL